MKLTQQGGVGALGAVHIRSTDRNDRLFPSFVTHGIVISIGVFNGSVSIFGFIFFWFFQTIHPSTRAPSERMNWIPPASSAADDDERATRRADDGARETG